LTVTRADLEAFAEIVDLRTESIVTKMIVEHKKECNRALEKEYVSQGGCHDRQSTCQHNTHKRIDVIHDQSPNVEVEHNEDNGNVTIKLPKNAGNDIKRAIVLAATIAGLVSGAIFGIGLIIFTYFG
jgi:hypothetical protein